MTSQHCRQEFGETEFDVQKLADKYLEVEIDLTAMADELDVVTEELVMQHHGARERETSATFDDHIDDHHDEVKADTAELKRLLAVKEDAMKTKGNRQNALDDEAAVQQLMRSQIEEASVRLDRISKEKADLQTTHASVQNAKAESERRKHEMQLVLEATAARRGKVDEQHAQLLQQIHVAEDTLTIAEQETLACVFFLVLSPRSLSWFPSFCFDLMSQECVASITNP